MKLLLTALTLIIVWGTAYNMVGVGVRYISPIWLVAGRVAIGAALVSAYVYISGQRLPSLRDRRWLWYAALGMSGTLLPFWLLSIGQQSVDSGLTAIMVGIMPLLTIVLAHFFAGERMNLQKFIGFIIGFIGIIILFLPDNFSLELVGDWQSQIAIVTAAFLYALTTIGAKRAPKTPSAVAAAMMLICAGFTALIFATISGLPTQNPPLIGWVMVFGLAIASTALGTILFLSSVEEWGPSMLARINYFPPIVSVIVGVWWLDEPFTPRIFIAFIAIITGIMISRIKRPTRGKAAKTGQAA